MDAWFDKIKTTPENVLVMFLDALGAVNIVKINQTPLPSQEHMIQIGKIINEKRSINARRTAEHVRVINLFDNSEMVITKQKLSLRLPAESDDLGIVEREGMRMYKDRIKTFTASRLSRPSAGAFSGTVNLSELVVRKNLNMLALRSFILNDDVITVQFTTNDNTLVTKSASGQTHDAYSATIYVYDLQLKASFKISNKGIVTLSDPLPRTKLTTFVQRVTSLLEKYTSVAQDFFEKSRW